MIIGIANASVPNVLMLRKVVVGILFMDMSSGCIARFDLAKRRLMT